MTCVTMRCMLSDRPLHNALISHMWPHRDPRECLSLRSFQAHQASLQRSARESCLCKCDVSGVASSAACGNTFVARQFRPSADTVDPTSFAIVSRGEMGSTSDRPPACVLKPQRHKTKVGTVTQSDFVGVPKTLESHIFISSTKACYLGRKPNSGKVQDLSLIHI